MMEFYPDLAAFYAQPLATVKEIVQAKIRWNLAAAVAEKSWASV